MLNNVGIVSAAREAKPMLRYGEGVAIKLRRQCYAQGLGSGV